MPTFLFEAMDATGQEIKDKIHAPDEVEAQAVIRQMGYFVTKIREARSESAERSTTKIHLPTIKTKTALVFVGGLAIGLFVGLIIGVCL